MHTSHERATFRQHGRFLTKAWSESVSRANAFVFVIPEYNHSAPPSLVNALDYLVNEWSYKPVGFVSYGGAAGGARYVESIIPQLTARKLMPLIEAVLIPFFPQFLDKDSGAFRPNDVIEYSAGTMLDELARWTQALSTLRNSGDHRPQ